MDKWNCTSEGYVDDPVLRSLAMKLAKHCKKTGYSYVDLSFVEGCANISSRTGDEKLKTEWRFMR